MILTKEEQDFVEQVGNAILAEQEKKHIQNSKKVTDLTKSAEPVFGSYTVKEEQEHTAPLTAK